jgi:hypothetical protein
MPFRAGQPVPQLAGPGGISEGAHMQMNRQVVPVQKQPSPFVGGAQQNAIRVPWDSGEQVGIQPHTAGRVPTRNIGELLGSVAGLGN